MVPFGNSNFLGSPCSYAASSQCLPRFPMFTPSSATSALCVFSITAVTLGPGFTSLGPLFYLPNWTKQCEVMASVSSDSHHSLHHSVQRC